MRYPRTPHKPLAKPQYQPFYHHPVFPLIVIGTALAITVLMALFGC